MYHPTRGGVRGGRDQFTWDDVKVDKHRENYLGHSIKAPVGRWQKGKDLHWYARDKKSSSSDVEAAKEEIRLIKELEEQAMREALGLAPKTASRSHGSRLDKHEFSELVKRGSTAEDLGAGNAEAAQVQGVGFSRAPRAWEESGSLQPAQTVTSPGVDKMAVTDLPTRNADIEEVEDENSRKKRRREEKRERREERHERRGKHEKHEKRNFRDSDDRKKRRDKEKRRHDSD